MFEWDKDKNRSNIATHGLDFIAVKDFPWHEAVLFDRSHPDDGERRFVAVGMLNE